MKTSVFVFVLLFCLGPLSARTDDASGAFSYPLSPETRGRFNSVCGALAEHPVIRGNFEQTKTLSRLKRTLVSRGNFIIAADMGMVWETLSPFPSTMTVGRDFIIQQAASGSRTKIDALGNETFLRLSAVISAVFSGNSQKLLDNFEIFFTGSEGGWVLGLVPFEQSIRSFADRIIMRGDSVIRSINLYENNGDTITYILSNHVFPGALSPIEKAFFSD
jgi:hypothetical protein